MTALPPPRIRPGWVVFNVLLIAVSYVFLCYAANFNMQLASFVAGSMGFAGLIFELSQPRSFL